MGGGVLRISDECFNRFSTDCLRSRVVKFTGLDCFVSACAKAEGSEQSRETDFGQ
jgi:hypothetical protein